MTTASELFHSRRVRFGLRHNAAEDSGCDSSPADASYSFSHHHRTTTTNRRHHHHHSSQNTRRDHRHDLDGCDPPSRRIHRHRLALSEHEPVPLEQGGSIVNSEDFRSIRRQRATGNNRLPGAVLLARERLLERLRGVSVSGNRQSNRSSSSIRHDETTSNGSSSFAESSRKHPPGLALDPLPLEAFSGVDECTICLEGFQDGEKIVRLRCRHGFHSGCLVPWVRVCGACPNCREAINLTLDEPPP